MLQQIWGWIKHWWQKFLSLFRSQSPLKATVKLEDQPLSSSEYEHFFLQLLDGVKEGWSEVEVGRFFSALKPRASIEDWVKWLNNFGNQLVASSGTNHGELGQRLLLLSQKARSLPELEELAAIVASLSTQLSDRQHSHPELPPIAPLSSTTLTEGESSAQQTSWFEQGLAQLDAEDYHAALISFDRAIEVDGNDHRAWINRGNALTNLGQLEEAIASFDCGIGIQPDSHIGWNNRGDALFESNQIEQAIASWDRALELQPDSAETWYNRGMGLGALNRWEEAIASWDHALALNSQDEESWFNRGLGLAQLSRWEEAIASWDHALELKPDWRDAWINKGLAFQKLGRYAEAIDANHRAIALHDDSSSL